MKCPNCGQENPDSMKFCGRCGRILVLPAVEPIQDRNRLCISCGRTISWDAVICMYCGHDYRVRAKQGEEGYLMTGAVLTTVAGFLAVALLTILTVNQNLGFESLALVVVSYCCSFLGIVGGIAGLARRWFPIAVLGGACAIFTPAFYFAIPGLALVAKSASSFEDYQPKK